MNLTYEILSQKEETLIKFFYQEGKRYGEFYIRLEKNTASSSLGISGKAVFEAKDQDYAFPLLQGFSEALEFVKRCDVCGQLFKGDRKDTCDFCFEEIQNDHMGKIEE